MVNSWFYDEDGADSPASSRRNRVEWQLRKRFDYAGYRREMVQSSRDAEKFFKENLQFSRSKRRESSLHNQDQHNQTTQQEQENQQDDHDGHDADVHNAVGGLVTPAGGGFGPGYGSHNNRKTLEEKREARDRLVQKVHNLEGFAATPAQVEDEDSAEVIDRKKHGHRAPFVDKSRLFPPLRKKTIPTIVGTNGETATANSAKNSTTKGKNSSNNNDDDHDEHNNSNNNPSRLSVLSRKIASQQPTPLPPLRSSVAVAVAVGGGEQQFTLHNNNNNNNANNNTKTNSSNHNNNNNNNNDNILQDLFTSARSHLKNAPIAVFRQPRASMVHFNYVLQNMKQQQHTRNSSRQTSRVASRKNSFINNNNTNNTVSGSNNATPGNVNLLGSMASPTNNNQSQHQQHQHQNMFDLASFGAESVSSMLLPANISQQQINTTNSGGISAPISPRFASAVSHSHSQQQQQHHHHPVHAENSIASLKLNHFYSTAPTSTAPITTTPQLVPLSAKTFSGATSNSFGAASHVTTTTGGSGSQQRGSRQQQQVPVMLKVTIASSNLSV